LIELLKKISPNNIKKELTYNRNNTLFTSSFSNYLLFNVSQIYASQIHCGGKIKIVKNAWI